MIAVYLCDENRRRYGLKKLVLEFFGYEMTPYEKAGTAGEKSLGDYAKDDVKYTMMLWKKFEKKLKEEQLESVFYKIEMPLVRILAEMEMTGMRVDLDYLKSYLKKLKAEQRKTEKKIYKLSGKKFNVNSTQQVGEVLFKDLGISTKNVPRGKSGEYSTAKAVLDSLAGEHKVIDLMLHQRRTAKLISTYVEKLLLLGKKTGGRIRTHFNQTGTIIGRLSSSDPVNFQNMPRERDSVRKAFIADEGKSFVDADLSQVELRLMAHLSGDKNMMTVYNSDGTCDCEAFKIDGKCRHVDIHALTAEDVGVPRTVAKGLNFGVQYRIGPKRFVATARDITLSEFEARTHIQNWFKTYSGVANYHAKVEDYLRANKWKITNLFGRHRRLSLSRKMNEFKAVTQGIQFTVSSAAQDLLKLSMIRIWNEKNRRAETDPRWREVFFVNQVHDELMLEVPDEIKEDVAELVQYEMEHADRGGLRVKLKSSLEIGKSWDDVK